MAKFFSSPFHQSQLKKMVEARKVGSPLSGDDVIHIIGVGTAFPPNLFTQDEVRQLLGVTNPKVLKLLRAPHIQTRALYFDKELNESLGQADDGGTLKPLAPESAADLHNRFLYGLRDIGVKSALKSMQRSLVQASGIDVIVAVTNSGLAMPGFSAILTKELGLRSNVQRIDLVGMGCNAGMSGLRTLSSAVQELSQRSKLPIRGLLVCCEVNSAIYVNNESIGTGIVNSLFGDGAASLVLESQKVFGDGAASLVNRKNESPHVALVDFETGTFEEYFDGIQYEVDPEHQRLNLKLSKQVPYVVGKHAPTVVKTLLRRNSLLPSNVSHWVVHTGGAKIIKEIAEGLGLDEKVEMRHTTSVLRDHGNIYSGSFIASYERLVEETLSKDGPKEMKKGDVIVLIAMGPGATIEAGLGIVSRVPEVKNGTSNDPKDIGMDKFRAKLPAFHVALQQTLDACKSMNSETRRNTSGLNRDNSRAEGSSRLRSPSVTVFLGKGDARLTR